MALIHFGGASPSRGAVFINEIHYDNVGTDTGEGVEVAGPAGTDLSDYELIFYNGATPSAAVVYATMPLTGMLLNMANGYGVAWFAGPSGGVQNGGNDGVALYRKSTQTVVQLLSYEGTLTASGGAAAGQASQDIGVTESNTGTAVGQSLQLSGAGTEYSDFHWNAPQSASPGQLNTGQILGNGPVFTTTLTIQPQTVPENVGPTAVVGTLILSPEPSAAVIVNLSSSDPTEATVPTAVTVPPTGSVTFQIAIQTDDVPDGDQTVTIAATPDGGFPQKQTAITVVDVDQPVSPLADGTIRLATFNVLSGVGTPGSVEFNAVKAVLQQINPDVIAFEEVSDAAGFSDLKTLLTQLGFPVTPVHFAASGDGFAGQSYVAGDFGTGAQSIALASRFPITQTIQIGRGVPGRKEMTRYPLFVAVDIPGVPSEQDPAFVAVHLKANSTAIPNDPKADQFRRALESYRVSQFLQEHGWNGAGKNLFVLGDFNQNSAYRQASSFETGTIVGGYIFADGTSLPQTFQLGTDLTGANGITLTYDSAAALFPFTAMVGLNLNSPVTRQADGGIASFIASGNSQLDYIFCPAGLVTAGLTRTEIYNSRLEAAFDGLPKQASSPTNANISFEAADHAAVWGDFALSALPRITLTPAATLFQESDGIQTTSLTVSLSRQPGSNPVTVELSTYRPGRVRLPQSSVILTGNQTSAIVTLEILHPASVDPHRMVTVSANAEGWFPATANLEIRNEEAGGQVLISQYIEPETATEPKAIEVFNQSGTTLDFSKTPLLVRRFSNGDTLGEYEAKVTSGLLEQGAVLVIGGAPVGEYLLAQGLIISNGGVTPSTAATGTPFFAGNGALRYWKDTFTYNGDDALELLLHFTRQDVFGMIGEDPGSAWSGTGVSTANQNLELRGTIGTGSSGFRDPSARFSTTGNSDALDGFGVPPTVQDAYLAWAGEYGLSGLSAAPDNDADGDGLVNFAEYALLTSPISPSGSPWQIDAASHAFFLRRRVEAPGLHYELQTSPDLQTWTPQLPANIFTHGDGTETATISAGPGPRWYLRQAARRE